MYPIRKLCITFGSISKEGSYDLKLLIRSRFKALTVVEDEIWILVGIVPVTDVRLQSSQWLSAPKNYSTHPILAVRIGDDIEDRVDQGRLSNTGLDRSKHITEDINKITHISDEDDA